MAGPVNPGKQATKTLFSCNLILPVADVAAVGNGIMKEGRLWGHDTMRM